MLIGSGGRRVLVTSGVQVKGVGTDKARRWLSAMHDLPDLFAIINADGYLDYASPSSLRLLDLTPRQLVGRRACEFIPAEDRRNSAAALARAAAGESVPGFVHRLVRGDGVPVWFETQLRQMRERDGHPYVVAVSRDVSDRAAADERLDQLSDIWHTLADIMSEGVLVIDPVGVIIGCNRAVAELLDAPPEQLTGTDVAQHLAVLDDHGHPSMDDRPWSSRAVRRRGSGTRSYLALRPDGRELRLRGRAVPIHRGSDVDGAQTLLLLERVDPLGGTPETNADFAASFRELLSRRELDVLRLLAAGQDVRAAAETLGISVHTARAYVKSVLRKLGVRTQLQAVVIALRAGLGDLA
jgi:PAS domain S-box-containing protein